MRKLIILLAIALTIVSCKKESDSKEIKKDQVLSSYYEPLMVGHWLQDSVDNVQFDTTFTKMEMIIAPDSIKSIFTQKMFNVVSVENDAYHITPDSLIWNQNRYKYEVNDSVLKLWYRVSNNDIYERYKTL